MSNDTTGVGLGVGDATRLLDLDGLAVTAVETTQAGTRLVRLATQDETAAACPACGVFSVRVKEYVCTQPRDLPQGRNRVTLAWRKRRWYCDEPLCGRKSFTESVPAIPARARITTRLREHAGDLVVDGLCATVAAAGRLCGVSWPVVMAAVTDQAQAALPTDPDPVDVLGIDEVRRGRPRWRPADPAPPPAGPSEADAPAPRPRESTEPAPARPAPGKAAPATSEPAKARVLADRWHVGFTDINGTGGMLWSATFSPDCRQVG